MGQIEYRLERLKERYNLEDVGEKVDYLKNAEQLLARIPNAVTRELYAMRLAEECGVSGSSIKTDVEHLRYKLIQKAKKAETKAAEQVIRNAQPEARKLRYEHPELARVEEELIRLLCRDPVLCKRTDLPDVSLFSSPVLGRFYSDIVERARSGQSMDADIIAQSYEDSDEHALFMKIIGSETVDLTRAEQALDDYIKNFERRKPAAASDVDALAELLRMKREQRNGG